VKIKESLFRRKKFHHGKGLNKLPIFISGVELPQSLRKMTLQLSGGNDFLETFGCKNGPSLLSLEKHQIKPLSAKKKF